MVSSIVLGISIFVSVPILIIYILYTIRKNKKKSFEELGKMEDADIEQIFVEHRGEKIPIRRREIPMWNKMGIADRSALLKTYQNAVKKGRVKQDGDRILIKKPLY